MNADDLCSKPLLNRMFVSPAQLPLLAAAASWFRTVSAFLISSDIIYYTQWIAHIQIHLIPIYSAKSSPYLFKRNKIWTVRFGLWSIDRRRCFPTRNGKLCLLMYTVCRKKNRTECFLSCMVAPSIVCRLIFIMLACQLPSVEIPPF